MIALTCTAFNVASPYKAYDDVLHRSVARWIAAQTAPGDQWIVFNGASPPPPVKDLMVMPWLQRVGEAHFYLLKYAPVPVRWEPAPQSIAPKFGGKIWLIVQNHGDADYLPADRLCAYQRAVDERLGQPQTKTRFALPHEESWSISEYSHALAVAMRYPRLK
jgi:hypothetical protein